MRNIILHINLFFRLFMFIANSKSNFDLVFSKCKEVLNDEILESFDTLEFVVIGLEFVLIGIVLCIGYISKYQ